MITRYHLHDKGLLVTDYYCQASGVFANGRPWSFGVHVTSAQSETALATTWNNAWTSAWGTSANALKQFYPVGTELASTTVSTLNGTFHEVSKTTTANVIVGTATGDTLPIQEAIVVSERSNSVQKFGRGRFYLPAMEETFVNDNVLDATAQGKISVAVNSVRVAIQADGSNVFVVSKKPHKDGTGQYTKTPITLWKVSNKPARQSKRNNKTAPVYV